MTVLGMLSSLTPPTQEGVPPPVNNACVPDIFNKLDAGAIERTRVLNSQLDVKLRAQSRVLVKYRAAAEQRYIRERDRVRNDLRNIGRRLPNYAEIPQLETKINQIKQRKKRTNIGPTHNCEHPTVPMDMKGLALEKEAGPYCGRYFTHHLPTKSRFYKDVLPSVKKGLSVSDLRPRPSVGINSMFPCMRSKHNGLSHNMTGKLIIPPIRSFDDNFVSSKSYLHNSNDDDRQTV